MDRMKCRFCRTREEDELHLGQMTFGGDIAAHYYCLLLSSGLNQGGEDDEGILGFLPEDINRELRRGMPLRCSYCHMNGATLGCFVKTCKKKFHLPCGLKRDSFHEFFGEFRTYCSEHRPKQKVKLIGEPEGECPICWEEVSTTDRVHTLWGACCKKAFYHRDCMQRQANSAGIQAFKCPLCNNVDLFQAEMQKFGIYIPEKDASWELEPNAFQELAEQYGSCDAAACLCSKGRGFSKDGPDWKIIRCRGCGSSATHLKCWQEAGGVGEKFYCLECRPHFSKVMKRRRSETVRGEGEDRQPSRVTQSPHKTRCFSCEVPPQQRRETSSSTSTRLMQQDQAEDSDSDVEIVNVTIAPVTFSRTPETFSRTPETFSRTPETFSGAPETFSGAPETFSRAPERPVVVNRIIINTPGPYEPRTQATTSQKNGKVEYIDLTGDEDEKPKEISTFQPSNLGLGVAATPPVVHSGLIGPPVMDFFARLQALKDSFLEPPRPATITLD